MVICKFRMSLLEKLYYSSPMLGLNDHPVSDCLYFGLNSGSARPLLHYVF